MAGNNSTKDFCLNGPWIKFSGEGIVRANYNIDMLAEAEEDNTDGLIETNGNLISFFTSTRDWEVRNSVIPEEYTYDKLWSILPGKTQLTSEDLVSTSGIYYYTGNFEADNQSVPNNYDNNTFNCIAR